MENLQLNSSSAKIFSKELEISTEKSTQFIDITNKLQDFVKNSGISEGNLGVYSLHTTAAIIINEKEQGLLKDLENFLERIASRTEKYVHDDLEKRDVPADEPINGHSHLRAILLGPSKTLPIQNGKIVLGRWQSVLFAELDGPRKRRIFLQVVGK
ncbi:MAG: secondary thiamine-phosphate synthase enzyme YjbQ [Candidatus Diapherotrites archaeon]|nr:secondary thiamine-phosphate synthase enzyme YjbQ [Candidatus Diapherotrites archaeon]